jgi:hypothetical protein
LQSVRVAVSLTNFGPAFGRAASGHPLPTTGEVRTYDASIRP